MSHVVSETTTPEHVARMRAALAEAGYPDAQVRIGPRSGEVEFLNGTVPGELAWKAATIAGAPGRCFACFQAAHTPCASHPFRGEDCGAER